MALWPGSPDMIRLGQDRWMFGDCFTRRLNWQETAVIQTFSTGMCFCGNLISVYRQIGNEVPCRLAEIMACHLYKVLVSVMCLMHQMISQVLISRLINFWD